MAEDESFLEQDHERIMNGLIKLQGQVRGMLLRKALRDIQKTYEEIVADIEEDMTVQWPLSSSFGRPAVRKRNEMSHSSFQSNRLNKQGHQRDNPEFSERAKDECVSTEQNSKPRSCPDSNYGVHFHSSDRSNERLCNCPCNSERINVKVKATASKEEFLHNSVNSSKKSLSIQNASQPSQGYKQSSSDGFMREDGISSSSISKEVQTDIYVEKEEGKHSDNSIDPITERIIDNNEGERLHEVPEIISTPTLLVPGLPNVTASTPKTCNELNLSDREGRDAFVNSSPSSMTDIETVSSLGVTDVNTESEDRTTVIGASENVSLSTDIPTNSTTVMDEKVRAPNKDNDSEYDFSLPTDKEELVKLKSTTAMELLWIEQAINSRKNYLRLRQQMAK